MIASMSGNALKGKVLEAVPSQLAGCHQHVLAGGEFVCMNTDCTISVGFGNEGLKPFHLI